MRTAIHKAISMYPEDVKKLNEISGNTGLSPSEVIRQLINKAYIDKKCRQIITQESFYQRAVRNDPGLASYNVQSVNEKKAETSHEDTPQLAVSLNNHKYYGPLDEKINQDITEVYKTVDQVPNYLQHEWLNQWIKRLNDKEKIHTWMQGGFQCDPRILERMQ